MIKRRRTRTLYGSRLNMRVSSALARPCVTGSCGDSSQKLRLSSLFPSRSLAPRVLSLSPPPVRTPLTRSTRRWHGNSDGSRTARDDEGALPSVGGRTGAPGTSFLPAQSLPPTVLLPFSFPPLPSFLPCRRCISHRFSSGLLGDNSGVLPRRWRRKSITWESRCTGYVNCQLREVLGVLRI